MNEQKITTRHTMAFIALASISFYLRLFFAELGYNNDIEMYWYWADSTSSCSAFKCFDADGKAFIALYGPYIYHLFSSLQSLALSINPDPTELHTFHKIVAGLLGIVDIITALVLLRGYKKPLWSAAILLLSPVAILLGGYHSQIDPIPIMMGLGAIALYERSWLGSAFLLAASFMLKQNFIYFPLWILLAPAAGSLFQRIRFTGTVYLIWALWMLPTLTDHAGAFQSYRSHFSEWSLNGFPEGLSGTTTMKELMDLFIPATLQRTLFMGQVKAGYMKLFGALLLTAGLLLGRKHKPKELVFFYLIAMVAFSPRLAIQYLAIPIVACAAIYRSKLLWWYHFLAAATIATSYKNIFKYYEPQLAFLARRTGRADFSVCQAWLLMFLVITLIRVYQRDWANDVQEWRAKGVMAFLKNLSTSIKSNHSKGLPA